MITLEEQIAEAQRELALRRTCYQGHLVFQFNPDESQRL